MKKEELLTVFPTPVQIYKYENSIEKELKYIEGVEWTEQKANGNFKSKDSYLTKHKELKDINLFFKECIDDFTKNIYLSKQKLTITQCWSNKNPKGSQHHPHSHPNSIVSGVFYLRQDPKLPPIQFGRSQQHSIKLHPEKYNILNSEMFILPCVAGELILFPSNLNHSVPINQGDEERISMSFNTFCIDVLGSEETLTHLDIRSLVNESN